VLVRGGDGLIYQLACADALDDCAASAAQPNAWKALPPPPAQRIFVGKPSAIWSLDDNGLIVASVLDDRTAVYITGIDTTTGAWISASNINRDLASDDPDPGVAITILKTPRDVAFFARNRQGLLVNETLGSTFFPLGGVLASPPSAVGVYNGAVRTDVAAIIDDHGHPGVWWRYKDDAYDAPCYYNSLTTCRQCGL
jgi:hypothetical protein